MTMRCFSGGRARWFVLPLGAMLCAAPGQAENLPAAGAPPVPAARLFENAVAFRMLAATDLQKAANRFEGAQPLEKFVEIIDRLLKP